MVHYDGTVRNSLGDIVQFIYGEDGMDAVSIESQKLETLKMNDNDLKKKFKWSISEIQKLRSDSTSQSSSTQTNNIMAVLAQEMKEIENDRDFIRGICRNANDMLPLPVNITRLITNTMEQYNITEKSISDLNPKDVYGRVENLISKLKVVSGNDNFSVELQQNARKLFSVLVRTHLSSKRVIQEYKLDEKSFKYILGEIEDRFRQSMVHPGEMIGPIAAQSIGETVTQMTLNTFHHSGVSAKNVTLGVPRLKELINVAKKLKTPDRKSVV